MKKNILIAFLAFATALPVYADLPVSASNIEAKFEGMFDFIAATRKQKKVPSESKLTGNQNHSGIDTHAFFAVTALNKLDDLEYGAKIAIQTTTQSSESVGSISACAASRRSGRTFGWDSASGSTRGETYRSYGSGFPLAPPAERLEAGRHTRPTRTRERERVIEIRVMSRRLRR